MDRIMRRAYGVDFRRYKMKLDLREIIEVPGARLPFERELDAERLRMGSVESFTAPVMAHGEVVNTAGVLTVYAEITARMHCVCDRCGREFDMEHSVDVEVPVVQEDEGDADGEAFSLEGDCLDIDDLLETAFILDMPTKFLCREDCKGVCPKCGKNLNDGECDCRPERDPRFAVLEQLLDK